MGETYVFVNIGKSEYLDLPSGKLGEIRGCQFSKDILTQYLTWMNSVGSSISVCFINSIEFYDRMIKQDGYKDITADVLFDMFEDGYKPGFYQFNWIYKKFEEQGRLKDLTKWFEKWDNKKGGD